MVVGAEVSCHGGGVVGFVEITLVVANGERVDRSVGERLHGGDDSGGVNAAREQRANGYIADHTQAYGVAQC